MRKKFKFLLGISLLFALSCTKQIEIIQDFPVDTNNIIDDSLAVFYQNISKDGKGSLSFSIQQPRTIQLYEVDNLQIKNTVISYSAAIKTANWNGNCYLEMWCFVDGGAYFSRSFDQTITQDTDWKRITAPFFLKNEQILEKVKLNIVADGIGDIWIDSVTLTKKEN